MFDTHDPTPLSHYDGLLSMSLYCPNHRGCGPTGSPHATRPCWRNGLGKGGGGASAPRWVLVVLINKEYDEGDPLLFTQSHAGRQRSTQCTHCGPRNQRALHSRLFRAGQDPPRTAADGAPVQPLTCRAR